MDFFVFVSFGAFFTDCVSVCLCAGFGLVVCYHPFDFFWVQMLTGKPVRLSILFVCVGSALGFVWVLCDFEA